MKECCNNLKSLKILQLYREIDELNLGTAKQVVTVCGETRQNSFVDVWENESVLQE